MNKLIIASVLIVLTTAIGACSQKKPSEKKGLPLLKISENQRFLVDERGNPFFWLGDTGWLLFTKLTREEADQYLTDRAAKGFNVIQVMALHSLNAKNVYGDSALINMNVATPLVIAGNSFEDTTQYDYWDHVDYIIDRASEKGIYIGMVPVWGSNVKSGKISQKQAVEYSSWLAHRYKDRSNIIWLNGGDILGSDSIDIWKAMGHTINEVDSNHLITFHPFGRKTSSIWFHNENWLDFNMFQSGHRRYDQDDSEWGFGQDNWKYANNDYSKNPVKPTIDGEPSYEGIPQGLHDTLQPLWNENDMRRYAYWAVFEGAMGHTYGHNSIMQFLKDGEAPGAYGARLPWQQALMAAGADQMKYVKELVLSKPYFERVPNPFLVEKDQGTKYDYLASTSGKTYAFIYTYNGRTFNVQMGLLDGERVKAAWFNPRNGQTDEIGVFPNEGSIPFDPPGEKLDGNDWVLVLDSSVK